mmetsp:Transcript_13911/g.45548  ORF Transcript_13911/g.45548 Transcript_13911/m.45548 type:complete len:236 (+) Transcript_13911:2235-2942(+)
MLHRVALHKLSQRVPPPLVAQRRPTGLLRPQRRQGALAAFHHRRQVTQRQRLLRAPHPQLRVHNWPAVRAAGEEKFFGLSQHRAACRRVDQPRRQQLEPAVRRRLGLHPNRGLLGAGRSLQPRPATGHSAFEPMPVASQIRRPPARLFCCTERCHLRRVFGVVRAPVSGRGRRRGRVHLKRARVRSSQCTRQLKQWQLSRQLRLVGGLHRLDPGTHRGQQRLEVPRLQQRLVVVP